MAYQHGDNTDRRQNVSIKHVLQGRVDGLGRKPRADKTWVHLQNYFMEIWTAMMRYQGDTPHTHGFESAYRAEENRSVQAGRLSTNLHEVAVAANSNKNHIQQMTPLKVVKKQQSQIDK